MLSGKIPLDRGLVLEIIKKSGNMRLKADVKSVRIRRNFIVADKAKNMLLIYRYAPDIHKIDSY